MASYTYNGFGQRVLKAFPGGTGEIYQYGQNGMLLEETDQAGTPQADYIYLNGRPIATLNPATGTLYYLQDDRLGTPQLATDSSQTVAWQAAYGPFGQASVSGSITQNLRFPGQYYDIETDWNHNGFRDYIPALGRYAEPDPLTIRGEAPFYEHGERDYQPRMLKAGGSTNAYSYVDNNPSDLSDPFGLTATSNWNYFWDWVFGRGPRTRFYGPNDFQTQEFMHSPGVDQIRQQFYRSGCKSQRGLHYGTAKAYSQTIFFAPLKNLGNTAVEVGGFGGASIVNNGNGTATFTIPNTSGAHSFFYHLVPNRKSPTGMMSNIYQTFQWTEPIKGKECGCRQ